MIYDSKSNPNLRIRPDQLLSIWVSINSSSCINDLVFWNIIDKKNYISRSDLWKHHTAF